MKKLFAAVLCLLLAVSLIPLYLPAASADTEGECGDDLTWSFEAASGTLTIDGKGDMWDFLDENGSDVTTPELRNAPESHAPWYSLREQIKALVLTKELTKIGSAAFMDCTALSEVTIPNKVKIINAYAFADCTALSKVTMGNTVKYIGVKAFDGCDALNDVYYDLTLKMAEKIEIEDDSNLPPCREWHVNEYLYGDANLDGDVTAADAAMVLRHVVRLIQLSEIVQFYCDVDNAPGMNVPDAAMILRHVVKLVNLFER